MKNVVMPKAQLVEILTKNRDGHEDLYEKAYEVFRGRLIQNLTSMLDRAKNGDKVELYVGLPEPENHVDDYNRALSMLGHDVRDEIELAQHEYAQFVQDDWGWKQSFATSTTSYLA